MVFLLLLLGFAFDNKSQLFLLVRRSAISVPEVATKRLFARRKVVYFHTLDGDGEAERRKKCRDFGATTTERKSR